MRILYLLFAVVFLLFQAAPGSADPGLFADTTQCRSEGNFCRVGPCPPTFAVSGSCHGGLLKCCSK
ncbi:GLL10 protein, partial [Nyctibius grandis]|nr:GLL10 protein [Nyctibius grandis]NXQ92724.1 GLL10 protein [Nyctibius grandis]